LLFTEAWYEFLATYYDTWLFDDNAVATIFEHPGETLPDWYPMSREVSRVREQPIRRDICWHYEISGRHAFDKCRVEPVARQDSATGRTLQGPASHE
jgi:hypothetical protein